MLDDKKHIDLVQKKYQESPTLFRNEFRDFIEKRVVVKGMWPTEALLAGGGGVYKIKADPAIWEKNSDPFDVMNAQCVNPDNSQIEIAFKNHWQFQGGVNSGFVVRFSNGVVVDIEKSNK